MGLTQSLGTAAAGLRATQAGLSLVAANVANAQTQGYTRKSVQTQVTAAGGDLVSVRVAGVNRELDQYLQRQLRAESSGGAYADLRAQFYDRLQTVYGDPNSSTSLETVYGEYVDALQALTTNPSDSSARLNVLNAGAGLAQQLQTATGAIQTLRSEAEQGLADSVNSANQAMQALANVNRQLSSSHMEDAAKANLLDQRDRLLDQLAQLMDIRVTEDQRQSVNVFTSSGVQLVGADAARLAFDPQGVITANSQWSSDSTVRSLGTITLNNPNGASIDLIAARSFRSGRIAAYLEMRDQVLPQAQTQLDEFAAGLSVAGLMPQAQYDIDVSNLQDGQYVQLTYKDTLTNEIHTAKIVRVDDPANLPLPSPDPDNPVIGVDWSRGLSAVVAQINAAFNGEVQVVNPSGQTLRLLYVGDGADIDAACKTQAGLPLAGATATKRPAFSFFADGQNVNGGAIASGSAAAAGFAGRIAVNPALIGDPARLIAYTAATAATPSGDLTRPHALLDRMTSATISYSPQSGIGSTSTPFAGPLAAFLRQAMAQQGDAASGALGLSEGQKMVVDALRQRFDEGAAVNVDQEMTTLLTLQTAYGANARVFTAVKDMIDMLLAM